jgi:hypothetical protein
VAFLFFEAFPGINKSFRFPDFKSFFFLSNVSSVVEDSVCGTTLGPLLIDGHVPLIEERDTGFTKSPF